MKRRRRAVAAGLTAAAVLLADTATKALVRNELGGGELVQLPLGASIAPGENRGAAFGLLAGSGGVVLVLAAIGVCCVALGLVAALRASAGASLASALLLGGALANILDRAGDSAVTDFINIGPWPAFNLADVAITSGVVLLALLLARRPEPQVAKGSTR